jgi:serine/threonine protein kinase
MNFTPGKPPSFPNLIANESLLAQLCGQKQLFCDRYQILKMLGRGGFGVTFLATDISLPGHPLCVIKQLCPQVKDPTALHNARKRFEREAEVLAKLGKHSQIPLLLAYFSVGEDFYLIQEYIPGMTLSQLIRRHGILNEQQVKRILCQILPVLEYIHSQGVIHRDIKPHNIIRREYDGELVLIDFGAVKEEIAKIRTQNGISQDSTTHFIGTVGFAPPEQFSLRPVFATDIYSLGVTCIYLLTGKPPLDFESDIRTGRLKWEDSVQVSQSFAKVLDKMIQPALENRFKTASDVLRALGQKTSHDDLYECVNQAGVVSTPEVKSEPEETERRYPFHIRMGRAIRELNTRFQKSERLELLKKINDINQRSSE